MQAQTEYFQLLEKSLLPEKQKLQNHAVYDQLRSLSEVRRFMESHIFAVWDFMSLVKFLQQKLTCVNIPWLPVTQPVTARFINEIVLGEETDFNLEGKPQSHFEMYLDAMGEMKADASRFLTFLEIVREKGVSEALSLGPVKGPEQEFVKFTFDLLSEGKVHKVAAAFSFGREDLIPDMFLEILNRSHDRGERDFARFRYYLERHIELDGDDHGPMAAKMIQELCGTDPQKWAEAGEAAKAALQVRAKLWDGILRDLAMAPV